MLLLNIVPSSSFELVNVTWGGYFSGRTSIIMLSVDMVPNSPQTEYNIAVVSNHPSPSPWFVHFRTTSASATHIVLVSSWPNCLSNIKNIIIIESLWLVIIRLRVKTQIALAKLLVRANECIIQELPDKRVNQTQDHSIELGINSIETLQTAPKSPSLHHFLVSELGGRSSGTTPSNTLLSV